MDTDERPDLRRGGESKLFLKAETEKDIGFAFEVLNEVLFKLNNIAFDQQRRFSVSFRGVEVGEFIPDLIVFGSVIVDMKVIDRITDHERGQMLNFLRITKLRVGLNLNFKDARLEFERVVL